MLEIRVLQTGNIKETKQRTSSENTNFVKKSYKAEKNVAIFHYYQKTLISRTEDQNSQRVDSQDSRKRFFLTVAKTF